MTRVNNPADFGKVAILMGGKSAEKDISLKSGAAVLQSLQRSGVSCGPIDTADDWIEQFKTDQYDRAFIILHGRGGEDGVIQGQLEKLGVPYTGSGVAASATGIDKVKTKDRWKQLGLPTPEFFVFGSGKGNLSQSSEAVRAKLGFPVIVKPVNEGSSFGITKVTEADKLPEAIETAMSYDTNVIVEQWVEGIEYTAAILGHKVLPIVRLDTPHLFYDYDAKYNATNTVYKCPCGMTDEQEEYCKGLALKAFEGLGCSGWGRIDFICDHNGQPWLIEVNTVPGMTDHSLVPMAAECDDMPFDELVWHILESSVNSGGPG